MVTMVIFWSNFMVRPKIFHFDHMIEKRISAMLMLMGIFRG